jgi:hypothetical protein
MTPIFFRAFAQVGAVALNVSMIAGGHYVLAFCTGGLVSWIWWANSRTAASFEGVAPRIAYTFGAATGTVVGMFIGKQGWL